MRISTRGPPSSGVRSPPQIRRVASTPSIRGIRTSISTTSTLVCRSTSSASHAVARLGHDLHVRLGGEHHPEAGAQQHLVVDEHDADRHVSCPSAVRRRATARPVPDRGRRLCGDGRRRAPYRPGPQRQHGADPETAAGPRPGGQGAADHADPLPHPDQALAEAVPAALLVQLVPGAPAVVLDQQVERAVAEVEQDAGAGPVAAVLADVGQRLLHDAVRGQLHAAGQRPGLPRHLEPYGQARAAHLVDEVGELVDAGLRHVLAARVVAGAQQAEQPAHLGQRLPAGAGDGLQRLLGLVGRGVQDVRGAVRLDDHHRHVVGDHVVQLAGDPGPFGGDRGLGLRLALPVQPGRPLLQLRVVRPPGAQPVADHPGQREDHRQEERLEQRRPDRSTLVVRRPAHHRQRRRGQPGDQRQPGRPARAVGGAGVDDHQQRGVARVGRARRAPAVPRPAPMASSSIFSGTRRRSATTTLSATDGAIAASRHGSGHVGVQPRSTPPRPRGGRQPRSCRPRSGVCGGSRRGAAHHPA